MPLHGFGFVVLSNTVKSNCEEQTTASQLSNLKRYFKFNRTHKRMTILKRRGYYKWRKNYEVTVLTIKATWTVVEKKIV